MGFSSILIDQAHKQNNKLVKQPGGAIGLTENTQAFKSGLLPDLSKHTFSLSQNGSTTCPTTGSTSCKIPQITAIG